MSVIHRQDSILEIRKKEEKELEYKKAEWDRDELLLELDYKILLLEQGMGGKENDL